MDETRRRGLRTVCVASLLIVGALDLILWPFSSVSFAPALVHGFLGSALALAAGLVALRLLRVLLERVDLWADHQVRFGLIKELFEVLTANVLFSVFPIATYIIASLWPNPLVDTWLAWPEEQVGVSQQVVRAWVEANGLVGVSDALYMVPAAESGFLILYCFAVRREFTPAWEFAAFVTVAGLAVLPVWAVLPALSPFVYYGFEHHQPGPSFVEQLRGLRTGLPYTIDHLTGLITMPSFHAVFALHLGWVFRRERYLFPLAVALNFGVLLSIAPSGWHYLSDIAGGFLWAAGAVVGTEAILARLARRSVT